MSDDETKDSQHLEYVRDILWEHGNYDGYSADLAMDKLHDYFARVDNRDGAPPTEDDEIPF